MHFLFKLSQMQLFMDLGYSTSLNMVYRIGKTHKQSDKQTDRQKAKTQLTVTC